MTKPYPSPLLPVEVTVGRFLAMAFHTGAAPSEVAGVMQVVVQISAAVPPGAYVPVVLQVGNNNSTADAVWIAVSAN